jgi:hypothetical protein
VFTPRYSRNTARVDVKHQSINRKSYNVGSDMVYQIYLLLKFTVPK